MRSRLFLLFLLVPLAKGQQQMSHEGQVVRTTQKIAATPQNGMSSEEATVRNTYAKLSYACQVGVLAKAVLFNGKRFADEKGPVASDQAGIERELAKQPDLELKDFRIGDVAQIKDKPLASFITVPTDSFKLINDGANYGIGSQFSTTNTTISWATLLWRSSQEAAAYSKEVSDETSKKTIGQLVAPARVPYSRYASFSVHAILQGKSISYNALFLFPQDAHKGDLWPIDTVIGSELITLTKAPLYPGALVETTFRELPVVRAWIDSHRISACPVKGQRAVCCDPQTGICGLDDETVQKAMGVPVDPITRDAMPKGKAQ
jgi:hypothetical protein